MQEGDEEEKMTGQRYTGLFWSDFEPGKSTVKKLKAPKKKVLKSSPKKKNTKEDEGPFIAVVGTR